MCEGLIFDIKRFAINDGPGIRTTVFLKGCPLRCFWCHNPEGQAPEPQLAYYSTKCVACHACAGACHRAAISPVDRGIVIDRELCDVCGRCVQRCPSAALDVVGRRVSLSAVVDALMDDKIFYDESGGGVTISGGEPLMQPQFAAAIARQCRERGVHVALDTCGLARWDLLESVARECDMVLYDVKAIDPYLHREGTGADNAAILDNLRRLASDREGPDVVIRRPLVPGYNDSAAELEALGQLAADLNVQVEILPYHGLGASKYEALGMAVPQGVGLDARDSAASLAEKWREALAGAGVMAAVV